MYIPVNQSKLFLVVWFLLIQFHWDPYTRTDSIVKKPEIASFFPQIPKGFRSYPTFHLWYGTLYFFFNIYLQIWVQENAPKKCPQTSSIWIMTTEKNLFSTAKLIGYIQYWLFNSFKTKMWILLGINKKEIAKYSPYEEISIDYTLQKVSTDDIAIPFMKVDLG